LSPPVTGSITPPRLNVIPTGPPDPARALTDLGVGLREVGRHRDALTTLKEALTIRRDLAAAEPDRYRSDLAGALTNLGLGLQDVGQRHDAHKYGLVIWIERSVARPVAPFRSWPGSTGCVTGNPPARSTSAPP
jgi:hypothetical protein